MIKQETKGVAVVEDFGKNFLKGVLIGLGLVPIIVIPAFVITSIIPPDIELITVVLTALFLAVFLFGAIARKKATGVDDERS